MSLPARKNQTPPDQRNKLANPRLTTHVHKTDIACASMKCVNGISTYRSESFAYNLFNSIPLLRQAPLTTGTELGDTLVFTVLIGEPHK